MCPVHRMQWLKKSVVCSVYKMQWLEKKRVYTVPSVHNAVVGEESIV